MTLNEQSLIVTAFKSNKEFVLELVSDINNDNNRSFEERVDMINKIMRAYREYSENLVISNETNMLISSNKELFLQKIEDIKKRQKSNQNINQQSELQNTNNQNINENNQKQNTNPPTDNKPKTQSAIIPDDNQNTSQLNQNQSAIIPNEDDFAYVLGATYSNTYANRELENQIKNLESRITELKNKIYVNDEVLSSKSEFIELNQLTSAKEALEDRYNKTNDLQQHYNDNKGIIWRDNRINEYQKAIKETKEKLGKKEPKFIKVVLTKRLEMLQNKQCVLKDKQKIVIDKSILNIYNKSRRDNKSKNRSDALTQYYDLKKKLLEIKQQNNLDEINTNSKNVITNLKNIGFKLKNVPIDLQLEYIKKMKAKPLIQKKPKFTSKTIVQAIKQNLNFPEKNTRVA